MLTYDNNKYNKKNTELIMGEYLLLLYVIQYKQQHFNAQPCKNKWYFPLETVKALSSYWGWLDMFQATAARSVIHIKSLSTRGHRD